MKMSKHTIMKYFGIWPPFLSCGIKVKEFDLDKGYVVSQLKSSKWNANIFGTIYGGSLFSMCDPFYVFLLSHKLGKNYYIWDLEAQIKFIKATKELVTARFELSNEKVDEIKAQAASGDKVTPVFNVQIKDPSGQIVAEIQKTLYVRLKPKK